MSAPRTPTADAVMPVVERLLRARVISFTPRDEGAYSRAGRWVLDLDDGRSVFVKAEVQPSERHGTVLEHRVATAVRAAWMPQVLAYEPGGDDVPRVLVTEDLSHGRWGVPVTTDDVRALAAALVSLHDVEAPDGLPDADAEPAWDALTPASLAGSGIGDEAWWSAALPVLRAAAAPISPAGDRLVHQDVWRQNWCIVDRRGAVLVDWSSAARGNPLLSLTWGEAAVRAAGGPPGLVLRGEPGWAAWMAGRAMGYLLEDWPRSARLEETQRREAIACVRWACEELDLHAPAIAAGVEPARTWRP